jgi:hypothetical protein
MKTLSIQQPWAWAILHAGKDIENRNWYTNIRGRVLIHAGKRLDQEGLDYLRFAGIKTPPTFELGGIVGSVEIVDCVRKSDSKWFYGLFGFVLKDPRPLPFMAVRGQLGFFEVNYTEVIA